MRNPRALVARIMELSERELWPGFDPRAIPLVLYTGERTLLINHPQPPAGFVPIPTWPGAYAFPGRHSAVRANTAATLGERPTAVVLLDRPGRRTRTALAALVIHEMFHVYQRQRHPDWTANEVELFVYPVDDVEQLQLRRLETRALRAALLARTPAALASWVATALEMRRRRFARLPAGAVGYERGNELQEGLATYVEWQAAWPARRPHLPADDFAADAVRERCYAVGHALAALLDRLAPGWAREMEANRLGSLDELLAMTVQERAVVPIQFPTHVWLATRVRAEEDVQHLVAERSERLADWHARLGWRIVAEADARQPLWPQGFDPSRVQRLTHAHVLHERWL